MSYSATEIILIKNRGYAAYDSDIVDPKETKEYKLLTAAAQPLWLSGWFSRKKQENEPSALGRREGKVLLSWSTRDVSKGAEELFEVEQYLNDTVATEIYKRWKIAVRFHI